MRDFNTLRHVGSEVSIVIKGDIRFTSKRGFRVILFLSGYRWLIKEAET